MLYLDSSTKFKNVKDILEQSGITFSLHSNCQVAVHIQSELDNEAFFPQVTALRKKLPDQSLLWLVSTTSIEHGQLTRLGVQRVLAPIGSTVQHIAERLLAELAIYLPQERFRFGKLLGISKAIQALRERILQIADLDEPILILGETGTGKGMVAEEIHRHSQRPGQDSFKINSAEFKDEHLESELFGYAKGSFTGAHSYRRGLIREAGQGTFFLDEIGELNLQSQAKLLSVIEDRRVRPLGANAYENIAARLIFATNRKLAEEVAAEKFRQDLYERLRVYELHLPPLRERRADILLLAQHFLDAFNAKYERALKLPDNCRDALYSHDWPGNVRELRSVVFRAAGFSKGRDTVASGILLESLRGGETGARHDLEFKFDPTTMTWEEVQARLKASYFRKLVSSTESKKEGIAISGLSKARFYDICKELGL